MSIFSLPGIPNIHSHAFQRAMAGLAERRSQRDDSFWTWRELMYRFAGRVTPESMHDIAAQLFVEMLAAGYTSVCEFHYLHHQAGGQPYDDPAAMSRALIAAARETGIRLTLLPVLYMSGGFDGRPLSERQRRFGNSIESYMALLETLRSEEGPLLRVGIALHSLRAVPEVALRELFDTRHVATGQPIHIHIAEQEAEVDECVALRGSRPVEWLLANAPVNGDWTLVHATHLTHAELTGITRSKAVVALCPTTEANLGDGLFPLREFVEQGGRFGVGSDSNVSVSPVEELRWLEYGQRLVERQRNIASTDDLPSAGESLLVQAISGGRHSNGLGEQNDDRLLLDQESLSLSGAAAVDVHDRFVFAGNRSLVKDVFVAGKQVISGGRHAEGDEIARRYRRTLRTLLADG
ncbi:MAG: formimidoylglutamate deiminase [Arenimonas sp.]|nr:formimidoylglutamate deiminase [Arenimonas sp.]